MSEKKESYFRISENKERKYFEVHNYCEGHYYGYHMFHYGEYFGEKIDRTEALQNARNHCLEELSDDDIYNDFE